MAKGGFESLLAPIGLALGSLALGPEVAALGGAAEAGAGAAEAGAIGADAATAATAADIGAGAAEGVDFSGGVLGAGNAFGLPAGTALESSALAGDTAGGAALGSAGAGLLGAGSDPWAAAAAADPLGLPGPPPGEVTNLNLINNPEVPAAPPAIPTPATAAAPSGAVPGAPASLLPTSGGGAGAITSPNITAGGFAGTGQPADVVSAVSGDPNLSLAAYQAAGGAPGSGIEGFAGKAGDYLLSHPGVPLTGLLAGQQLFKGNPAYPAETSIGNLASGTAGTAASLTAPLTTGVLPPGEQQMVNAGTQSAIAAAKSAYGNLGLSGSTMEADKIASIKQDAAAQEAKIANDLVESGAKYSSLSLSAYNDLLRAQMASDKDYRDALYNFSRSLGAAGYSPAATANA